MALVNQATNFPYAPVNWAADTVHRGDQIPVTCAAGFTIPRHADARFRAGDPVGSIKCMGGYYDPTVFMKAVYLQCHVRCVALREAANWAGNPTCVAREMDKL